MWRGFRSLKMQDAKGFSLGKNGDAQVGILHPRGVGARCRGIARHNQMRMSSTQRPAGSRFENRCRKLAFAPRANYFRHAVRGVEQRDGYWNGGANFGGTSPRGAATRRWAVGGAAQVAPPPPSAARTAPLAD